MLDLERELKEIEREGAIRDSQLKRRDEQFQLLLQSIMQLKAELNIAGKKDVKGSEKSGKGSGQEKKSAAGVAAAAASATVAATQERAEPLAAMLPCRHDAMQVDE